MTTTNHCQDSTFLTSGTTMLLALLLSAPSIASTITVALDGSGDYTTLQDAIDAASDGDEILVAPGTYYGEGESVIDFLGKAITLRSSGGADVTFIDGEGQRRGVIFENEETGESTLDGFTVQYGSATKGGGMYSYNGSPTVTNCTIVENSADWGGGMYSTGGVTFENCSFSDNEANSDGGGFFDDGTSSSLLVDCSFSGNWAAVHGGGMYSETSTVLVDSTFTGNGAALRGGGAYLLKEAAIFTGCTFMDNWASGGMNDDPIDNEGHGGGGGMHNYKGHPELNCCVFENNRAFSGVGGGMSNKGTWDGERAAPMLSNCTFTSNEAARYGGGIYNGSFGSPMLVECSLTGNFAGGLVDEGLGGGMYNEASSSDATLAHTLVCGNLPDQIEGPWNDAGGNTTSRECEDDCPADLDGDGVVNGADITMLLAAWGLEGDCLVEDLNGDDLVNGADLTILLSSWGACS